MFYFFVTEILKNLKSFEGDDAPFVMELPDYHLPLFKNVLKNILGEYSTHYVIIDDEKAVLSFEW